MIAFQRKIIYMGYAPIGSRTEEIEADVPAQYLKNIYYEVIEVDSENDVKLAGVVVRPDGDGSRNATQPRTVLIYLQGNTGNPLHRIPVFQTLLRPPAIPSSTYRSTASLAVVAVAPRSYWKSSRHRPTERGILIDYLHVVHYTLARFPSARVILYGHSLGGAAAVCLLARLALLAGDDSRYVRIKGLVLENPFASIPDMVRALYPQRWVPYRYLAPFAWDKWDAVAAMQAPGTVLGRAVRDILVFVSEKDEVVPGEMGRGLYEAARRGTPEDGMARLVVIPGALHDNAWSKRQWLPEMRRFIEIVDLKR